jgi:hypothetical protein
MDGRKEEGVGLMTQGNETMDQRTRGGFDVIFRNHFVALFLFPFRFFWVC